MTNWILDSSATCHMTPDISNFTPVSMVETDKYIEVADGIFITAKQTGKFQIKHVILMAKPSFLRYITYYLLQTCAIDCFTLQLSCIQDKHAFFIRVFSSSYLVIMSITC